MIDVNSLRKALLDYYGSAMMEMPMAVIELSRVENASDDEIIAMAKDIGVDLSDFEEDFYCNF